MKRLRTLLIASLALFSLGTFAETNGRKVLDNAASKIRKSGNIKVEFSATSFNGTTEEGNISGIMLLQGKKFHLATPDMLTWFNGKTEWTYVPENEEVNVTQPTAKELQAVNPYVFLDLYKKGYRISMREASLRGTATFEVHLLATRPELTAQELYIDVRQSDYMPLCVRVRQDNIWNRISIKIFAGGQHFSDEDFTFPREKYPDAEIIDLR